VTFAKERSKNKNHMGWMFGHSAHFNSAEESSRLQGNEPTIADSPFVAFQDQ